MSEQDLKYGTYVSTFEILSNKDATQSIRKISRQALKTINEPRIQLLEMLRADKPAHLLIPESIHAKPGEPLNEFYSYKSLHTLDDLSLARFIDQGKITEYQLASMFAQLTKAVGFLHQHGFVHRDIRPPNILVGEIPQKPDVILFDYSNVCRPYQPARRIVSWNEEHPNDPYIDYRFDVFSIGKIFYNLTHEWDDSLKPNLDEAHPLHRVISLALHPYSERPKNAMELGRLVDQAEN